MTMTTSLAELAGRHIDLAAAPFTLPASRILVFGEGSALRVHTAEYERSLADCRVIDELVVTDESGSPLSVTTVLPDRIELGGDAATITFAGESALSISAPGTVRWRTPTAKARHGCRRLNRRCCFGSSGDGCARSRRAPTKPIWRQPGESGTGGSPPVRSCATTCRR